MSNQKVWFIVSEPILSQRVYLIKGVAGRIERTCTSYESAVNIMKKEYVTYKKTQEDVYAFEGKGPTVKIIEGTTNEIKLFF